MDPAWLFEARLGGQTHRLAQRTIEATDRYGRPLLYQGRLLNTPRVVQRLDYGSDTPSVPSASVDVIWPTDLAALVEAGAGLSAATAELSLWWPDEPLDNREILLSGRLSASRYGAEGEAVSLTIEGATLEDDPVVWPPEEAIVDATSWPTAADSADGKTYPWVIGQPGQFFSAAGATPGLLVETGGGGLLLICGQRVAASTVRVRNLDDATNADVAVSHQLDGYGRTVAVCDLSGSGVTVATGDSYGVRWNAGGGILDVSGRNAIDTAGETLRWAAQLSGLQWDITATELCARHLDRYRFATYWDTAGSPLDWIRDVLQPIPISWSWGAGGLSPRAERLLNPSRMVARHFEAGPRWRRMSQVGADGEASLTNYRRIGYEPTLSSLLSKASQGARAAKATTWQAERSRLRRQRWVVDDGIRETDTDQQHIHDTRTARGLARDITTRLGDSSRAVSYAAPYDGDWRIPLGSVLEVTDAELSWTRRRVEVRGRTLDDSCTYEVIPLNL